MSRVRLAHQEFRGLDMTALIDIVIILISFFIFFNNAADSEQSERVKLPKSELAIPSKVMPAEPLTVNLMENGTIIFNNKDCTFDEFRTALSFECRLYQYRKIDLSRITVLIRGDGHSDSGKILDLIAECQQNGLGTFKCFAKSEKNE